MMNQISVYYYNHALDKSYMQIVESFEELESYINGDEITVNGGILFNNNYMILRDNNSIQSLKTLINYLIEKPDTTNEKLSVLYDLMSEFTLTFEYAIEFYEHNFMCMFNNYEEFGRKHAEVMLPDMPKEYAAYFDYERYGRDNIRKYKKIDNFVFRYGNINLRPKKKPI
jgi:hypothetical protein